MEDSRLFATLDALAACTERTPDAPPCKDAPFAESTAGGEGVTRFSWSEADAAARRFLTGELTALGLEPWTDGEIGRAHV